MAEMTDPAQPSEPQDTGSEQGPARMPGRNGGWLLKGNPDNRGPAAPAPSLKAIRERSRKFMAEVQERLEKVVRDGLDSEHAGDLNRALEALKELAKLAAPTIAESRERDDASPNETFVVLTSAGERIQVANPTPATPPDETFAVTTAAGPVEIAGPDGN